MTSISRLLRNLASPRARLGLPADRVLPLWFLGWSAIRIQQLGWTGLSWDLSFIGRDFWIYRNAALNLISGVDPWQASSSWNGANWHFAALPTAAQVFVPFAWLEPSVAIAIFVVLTVVTLVAGLRTLGLPIWWLLFPPTMEGLVAGNPQILVIGLLLVAAGPIRTRAAAIAVPVARAVAIALKVYALVPTIARMEKRSLVAGGLFLAISIGLAAGVWQSYLAQFGMISTRVVTESNGGLSAALFLRPSVFGTALPADETLRQATGLAVYGLIALLVLIVAIRDVRSAGWLAAPLLWPAAEYHLATMAIPVARRASIWLIAVPTVPTYLFGLIVLAYEITAGRRAISRQSAPVPLASWLRSAVVATRVGKGESGGTGGGLLAGTVSSEHGPNIHEPTG